MYINQKKFIYNVKDLSLLLVKDANYRFSENHHRDNNLFDNMQDDLNY